MTIRSHSASGILRNLHRALKKWRPRGTAVLSTLFTAIAIQALGQQMLIKRSHVLVLYIGSPVGKVDQYNGSPAYFSLVQKAPFIEVHLIQPLPATKVHRGRMVFRCEEVGIFTDASSKTWTIGKRCKLQ